MEKLSKLLGIALCTMWFFAILQNSYGQEATTWMKTYGGNTTNLIGFDITKCDNGEYIITGKTDQDGMLLINLDANGDSVSTKSYLEYGIGGGTLIHQTTAKDYIISGWMNTGIDNSLCYLKIDEDGDTVWTKIIGFGQEEGYCIEVLSLQQTYDDGFILTGGGHHHVVNPNWEGGFIIKTNQEGDTLWTRKDTTFCIFHSIQQANNGGYIMIGRDSWHGYPQENYLVKTDNEGNIIWKRDYGTDSGNRGLLFDKTAEGGFILLQNIIPDTTNENNTDIRLTKTDEEGVILWTKSYGGELVETGVQVLKTSDGGYIIYAKTGTSRYDESNIWLIKTNAEGDSLWTRTFYDTYSYHGGKIMETDDGGYIIFDNLQLSEEFRNIVLIKTDSNGNVNTSSSGEDQIELIINIYPNPTNSILTIETEQPDHYSINITSINGQLIFSTTMKGTSHQLDLSSFQKGLYFITIRSNNFITTRKIIKL